MQPPARSVLDVWLMIETSPQYSVTLSADFGPCCWRFLRDQIQAATQPNRLRPWFEADVRLKPPKGRQGSSIETASETPQEEDKNAIAVAPIGEEEKPEVSSQRSSPTSIVAAINFGDDTQEDPAAENLAAVAGLRPRRQKLTETLLPSHDEDGNMQLPEEKPKKKKSRRNRKKMKSKPMISEDESEASAVPVPRKIHELNSQSNPSESEGTYVRIHKPPRLWLTKAELAKHTEKVNDDEDVVWRTSYLEVNSTRGPVMGSVPCPKRTWRPQVHSPFFHQATSHLEVCKVTWSIETDLLAALFSAAALSWGLATVASAVTPPHTDYGGSAVKIHCLVGRKLWFIIRKRDEPSEAMSWDTFIHDFQADSKVDPNVYECEVIIVEPGSLW
ncbi:uncharacterized protein EV420DRAFT_1644580 [Desarmillaria tabescens]|uniref:Uncharacterized protein n=1 Tax=Armillaria tabescens TaxID=1929756 RepID=A0AA39KBK3_ARMTA|nr:uncharacterized protein EV420DRAFT_1644580 [Desarmillaria tabescens]KAK0455803.1 hypothetical protein EV420DRAFT_1644580 [Desarmillaria tabescens]